MVVALFAVSAEANATNTCFVSVNREACPGREEEAFAPYNGVNPTEQTIPHFTEAQCQEHAARYAKIVRRFVLKKIEVTSSYNGVALPTKLAEGPCATFNV